MGHLKTFAFVLFVWNSLLGPTSANLIFDPLTCGDDQAQAWGNALVTDVKMMAAAGWWAIDNSDNRVPNMEWQRFAVNMLFQNLFGGDPAGDAQRWSTVKHYMQTMGNADTLGPTSYVYCDDTALWGPPTAGGNQVFINPRTRRMTAMPGSGRRCMDYVQVNGGYRYKSGYRYLNDGVNIIVLCTRFHPFPNRLQDLPAFGEGTLIDALHTWSFYLFHELTHTLLPMRGQDTATTPGERYEWTGAMEVRETYCIENPDSLGLFAQTLAMDGWIWTVGRAKSKATVWRELNDPATPNAKWLRDTYQLYDPGH